MTIASTTSKISYNGSGSAGPFPITFKFAKDADIVATKRSSAGVETVLALTTDYTLTGAGDAFGGALTLVTELEVGESLVVARVPEIIQEVDYIKNSAFPAETHEGALDLLTTICQSLQEQIDRSVKVEISGTTSPDDLLAELAEDAASASSSAATAATQAGLANTARIAAEAAVASVPTTFGAFGLALAETTTASNARSELDLGGAALLNVGTAAGTVCAGNDSRFDAIGSDESARNLAIRNAIKLGILATDASGPVPSGYLWLFKTDELATKAGATYRAAARAYRSSAVTYTQYTPTGSTFGNMTVNGGLAAAFDGNTSQAYSTCAGISTTTGYCGKAFSVAQKISRVGIYGSNNAGYTDTGTGTITVAVYGKASLPGSITDGTILGTTTFANTSNESAVRYVPTDDTTAYPYVWCVVSTIGGGTYVYFAEIKYYITATVNNMTLIPLATTAGSSPKSVDLYVIHKAIDAVTLNTDLKARVTLDGTNWSGYGTLDDIGQYDADYKLLHANIDTSALTGTSGIKWELTTYNAKNQQVRAESVLLNF